MAGGAQPTGRPAPTEACFAGYGLNPAQKIKICSDVIDSGSAKGLALGLAHFNRAQALANAGDQKGAMADYRMALRYYTEVIRNSAPNAQVVFQRGLVYHDKAGKERLQGAPFLDKAMSDFNAAIRINPTAAAHFVGRASTHMYKEEFQPAIADFTEAIRLSPGDEYTFLHRGIAYHSVNEPDNAIADYTEAHRINPKDVAPLVNRGIVYYSKKGQYDLAIADFTEALKIDPKEINALINRGISWREKGDPDKAIADFTEALRLGMLTADVLKFGTKDPEAVRHWAQVAHARYQRGTAYVAKTEYDLALADFNESIRLNPKEAHVFVSRGGIYLYTEED